MLSDRDFMRNELAITCADALELMTDYLEGALSSDDVDRFTRHLSLCQGCTVYLDQLRMTVRVVGEISGTDEFLLDEETLDRLLALFRRGG
jgi:hypothetical protein